MKALPAGALVVLTHGLWMSRHALFGWRRHFARRGVDAVAFGYPSREPLDDNVRRLSAFIAAQRAAEVYLLGHSLGGLLILGLAEDVDARLPVARAVIAGTPVAGSVAGRRFAQWRFGRWLIAGAQPVLEQAQRPGWRGDTAPFELGIIAGTRAVGMGRLLGHLPAPNDGAVALAETRFVRARDSIALPLTHSQMLLSGRLIDQALAFFVNGHFDRHGQDGKPA